MENLIVLLLTFTLVFIVDLILVSVRKKKNTLRQMKEFEYLITRYKLNRNLINYNAVSYVIALVNAIIIAIVGTFTTMLDMYYIWQLLIGFAMLLSFIYLVYGYIGYFLKRKENKK